MHQTQNHRAPMNAQEILDELKPLGRESYKKVLFNHGVKEPCYGVKITELKKVQRRVKKDYQLALDLYDTGILDAMYLAGLIADDARMTKKDLQRWVSKAYCGMLCGYTVPWVAAGSPHGWELACEWLDSKDETVAIAGWGTLISLVSIKDDKELPVAELKRLLQRVQKSIHQTPDKVRVEMNAYVIAVGTYVPALTETALQIGEKIGPVTADLGDNCCTIPSAPDAIRKAQKAGVIGKKRKSAKC